MKQQPIIIAGKKLSRFGASKLLFKESFRFLSADKEMMWIPLVALLLNLFFFGVVVSIFAIILMAIGFVGGTNEQINPIINYSFIFASYVVGAFTFAISQAAITHTVYARLHEGEATLGQSLKSAFSFWRPLLLWSIITSTVGLILRMIAERSRVLGWLVVMVIGVAWSVMTYFVVPAMVIDKLSAFQSIRTSKDVFVKTWGETLVTNISLGLVFFFAHLVAGLGFIGLLIASVATNLFWLIIPIIIFYVVWLIIASLANAALNGVVKTLLYVYASENSVPQNFNQELLENMLVRKNPIAPPTTTPMLAESDK